MSVELQLLQSKIYSLQAEINSFNESGYFTLEEAARITDPLEDQVITLKEKLKELQAEEIDVVDYEALTPQKQ